MSLTDHSGQFIHTEQAHCSNGFEDDEWQIDLNNLSLAVANYHVYLVYGNECGSCIKKFTLAYQDLFSGTISNCFCRVEGTRESCCLDCYEANQYNFSCQTNTVNYNAINDLKLGINNSFNVLSGSDAEFTASNGSFFNCEAGATMRAEIVPCSSSKWSGRNLDSEGFEKSNAEQAESELFMVYPNPSGGNVMIENLTDQEGNIYIYNVEGRQVKMITVLEATTSLVQFEMADGLYFLKFSNQYGTSHEFLIISKN
ncbi:MAG: T9SS type A sorting domain-containing protein [Salibacteraceae bacterium]